MKDFGVVEALHQWRHCLSGNFGGLCTLIGVREKPGGRETANRGKKKREEEEGEEEKEKRKRKERETKKKAEGGAPYVAHGVRTVFVRCRVRCLVRCSVRASRDVRCDVRTWDFQIQFSTPKFV
jgi:hypothetical protein